MWNKMGDKYMSDSLIFYVEKDIFSTSMNDDVSDFLRRLKIMKGSSN
jgi:hypothetical protein